MWFENGPETIFQTRRRRAPSSSSYGVRSVKACQKRGDWRRERRNHVPSAGARRWCAPIAPRTFCFSSAWKHLPTTHTLLTSRLTHIPFCPLVGHRGVGRKGGRAHPRGDCGGSTLQGEEGNFAVRWPFPPPKPPRPFCLWGAGGCEHPSIDPSIEQVSK